MSRARALLKKLGLDLRLGEGVPLVLLFFAFFFIICFFYVSRTVRESEFLENLGSQWLPVVNLALALASYPVILLFSSLSERVEKHRLLIASSLVISGSMVLFWWALQFDSPAVVLGYYVWNGMLGVFLVSQFWTYSSLVFDPRQAKRLFGFLGAGGILGGLVGGQVARYIALAVGTRYALLAGALLLCGVAAIMMIVHRVSPSDEERVGGVGGKMAKVDKAKGGWSAIRSSRHLTLIMWIMILMVMVAQFVDLQLKWAIEVNVEGKDAKAAFVGNFYTIMNASALIFQLLLTSRIHRRLGVGFAMRVLPVWVALGSTAAWVSFMAFPGFVLAATYILRVGENGFRYSLEQATRELLFLPVPSKARIKAKAFIDVFVNRGAKGLSALLMLPVFFGWMHQMHTVWITLPLVGIWLFVVALMSKEYVHTFRQGLKRRQDFEEVPINLTDVTTLELLIEALGSSDPRQVEQSLDLLASHGRAHLVPPLLLYHDDPTIRRRTLEILRKARRHDAAGLVERRLGDENPDVRTAAIRALADFEGSHIAELMLPRLQEVDAGVRAAAVACLLVHGSDTQAEEAEATLKDLLSDADPSVRVEAAKALGAVPEPAGRDQMLRMLYDPAPEVVREAISAVRRRVDRDGYNPLYVPTLISLLHSRHLKADAREALVAFGERIVPTLTHFMGAEEEPIWVRRAIPKTLSRIGTDAAIDALIDSVDQNPDRFLQRKVIEALSTCQGHEAIEARRADVEAAIETQVERYLFSLHELVLLGIERKGELRGPRVDWSDGVEAPGLLERLLAERMEDHLQNIFSLLAALYPPDDIWAAYRSLLSGRQTLANTALEYLDNTLSSELRDLLAPLLDNRPVDEKLEHARRSAVGQPLDRAGVLDGLLASKPQSDDGRGLQVAAMYHVYSEGIRELYPAVSRAGSRSEDPFVRETSEWVARRVA